MKSMKSIIHKTLFSVSTLTLGATALAPLTANADATSQNLSQYTPTQQAPTTSTVNTAPKKFKHKHHIKTTATASRSVTSNTTPISNSSASSSSDVPSVSTSEAAARSFIALHESNYNYNAQNGIYYGKYQLQSGLLHGDYSPRNQEKVAQQYVSQRYGSWVNAMNHWKSLGWY